MSSYHAKKKKSKHDYNETTKALQKHYEALQKALQSNVVAGDGSSREVGQGRFVLVAATSFVVLLAILDNGAISAATLHQLLRQIIPAKRAIQLKTNRQQSQYMRLHVKKCTCRECKRDGVFPNI